LNDTAARLPTLCDDPNLKVRVRAFWALGSLADCLRIEEVAEDVDISTLTLDLPMENLAPLKQKKHLTKSMIETNTSFVESLNWNISSSSLGQKVTTPPSDPLIENHLKLPLLRASVAGCSDHEKVRSHAFRSFGRIASIVDMDTLNENIPLLKQGISNILSNLHSGSFKTRWNACHCLRHLLAYEGFPLGSSIPYTGQLYKELIGVSISSTNFKVKTGAILALSTPSSKARYGCPEVDSDQMIEFLIKNLEETALSVEITVSRAPIDDQKYLEQFNEAVQGLLRHFQTILGPEKWLTFKDLESEILLIIDGVGKQKSSAFNPKGS
jgi:hypothetical protein